MTTFDLILIPTCCVLIGLFAGWMANKMFIAQEKAIEKLKKENNL